MLKVNDHRVVQVQYYDSRAVSASGPGPLAGPRRAGVARTRSCNFSHWHVTVLVVTATTMIMMITGMSINDSMHTAVDSTRRLPRHWQQLRVSALRLLAPGPTR